MKHIVQIIFRLAANFVKDLPWTPQKLRVRHRLRRRVSALRIYETERLDRLRNPAKYRGV